ncbi:sulfate adenylyltransferase [Prochlorococcus sp. ALOHA_ZT_50]|jgi:sulfate adenylyltransferase|uniref:sulfate adenylyltransferase n=1 Tax=Prochlorococcus sp. ALOHA_ZT_50 TaxID=2919303 RepID=UPI000AF8B3F6|nr:sulfate adenylyltransferase [Prochlorococcus sp. ALOHA_ZT_50]MBO6978336.1 sulfate adenylyltransferase [Prochlorococcus marinus XMU1428]MCH2078945.1 sulfate adenylyltransferase [Prochlorococcus sp. ALOHA_ZT_50]MCH2561981.1 sulfate adenylyltransferase [Prochlorococcus sp. ALOHA_A2.0_50]|tara:strand:- start:82 stop:1257 length:1176 start_codon:yes stop_codon:yes gene_type:complete
MELQQKTKTDTNGLIPPYGGELKNLIIKDKNLKNDLISKATYEFECSERNACDVELLMVGAFSPLEGFMDENNYNSVIKNNRNTNGLLFGLPIVFDSNNEKVKAGETILLTYKKQKIAVLEVSSKWEPDKSLEAELCYGTNSLDHPAVKMIFNERGRFYIGGRVYGFELPIREFPCKTPEEVRSTLPSNHDVVAFQCRNPIHRAHYELFTNALLSDNVSSNSVVLVHPTCGPTQQDDIPGKVRYLTYKELEEEISDERIKWAFLPYSMHMAGPREALQHMIIRRNYGCTHFIIGRDMAGCKSSSTGEDFYGPYDAQNFANKCADELMMQTVPSKNLVYTKEKGYITAEEAKEFNYEIMKLSGTEFRKKLRNGEPIPEWFAFKSVVDVLRRS